MARVGRIAGSLLIEADGRYLLVGYPKEPCNYAERRLSTPPKPEAWPGHCIELEALGPVSLGPEVLEVESEAGALAQALAERLVITRNGSVSERLWRLVLGANDEGEIEPGEHAANWLIEAPLRVWNVVRDSVLRCS